MLYRHVLALLSLLLLTSLSEQPAFSQFARGPASRPTVVVVLGGSAPGKRPVAGKVAFFAAVPTNMKTGTVVFYVDDKEVDRGDKRPYRLEWDSTRAADGEHTAAWSAVDDQGGEIAAGRVVFVVGSGKQAEEPTAEPAFKTYFSEQYRVEIDHPSSWTVKDQLSEVTDQQPGAYWLIFSTDPVADAEYVVNLRHKMLLQEHSAESFVKYTPYVATWDRGEVNGRTVFTTTAGGQAAKRVIHRAMILDGRHLWMLNCIDTSGKPPTESKSIFTRMVNSLAPVSASNPEVQETGNEE